MTSIESYPLEQFIAWSSQKSDCRRVDSKAHDPRPLFLKARVLEKARGSAYIESGQTKLLCSIDGPRETGTVEASSQGIVHVSVRYASFANKIRMRRDKRGDGETETETNFADLLRDALTPVVILEKYPKSQIDIIVTVLEDSAGVLAAALTCAPVALADAGIELYDMALATSVAICPKQLLVDPSAEEIRCFEENSDLLAYLIFGFMPSLNQVCLCYQTGQMTIDQSRQAISLANEVCYRLFPVVQKAVTKAVQQRKEKYS